MHGITTDNGDNGENGEENTYFIPQPFNRFNSMETHIGVDIQNIIYKNETQSRKGQMLQS